MSETLPVVRRLLEAIADSDNKTVDDGLVEMPREVALDAVARIAKLAAALHSIGARAQFGQSAPTGLHMTCLSLIEKDAQEGIKAGSAS